MHVKTKSELVSKIPLNYQLTFWQDSRKALMKVISFLRRSSYPYKVVAENGKYAVFTSGAYIAEEAT